MIRRLPPLLTAVSLLAVPSPASATDTPPIDRIPISGLSANGPGCSEADPVTVLAVDATTFMVSSRGLFAWKGIDSSTTNYHVSCDFSIRITPPRGFTYAVTQTDHRGMAHLASGTSAVLTTFYSFEGIHEKTSAHHTLTGPVNDSWAFTDVIDTNPQSYAPCGTNPPLHITTDVSLSTGQSSVITATNFVSTDQTTVHHLVWKKCS